MHPSARLKSKSDGLDSQETVDDMDTEFPSISSIIDMILLHTSLEPSILQDGSDICSTRLRMAPFCADALERIIDEANNEVRMRVIVVVELIEWKI